MVINTDNRVIDYLTKVFSITIDLFYQQFTIALIGSCYSIESNCAVLEKDALTVLQDQTITQINVLDGSVIACKELDCTGCNFEIYRLQRGYLIYGELEITMLDFELNIVWEFGEADIFVAVTGKTAFELCDESIKLYDFNDNFYEIDFNGELIR